MNRMDIPVYLLVVLDVDWGGMACVPREVDFDEWWDQAVCHGLLVLVR